MIEFPCPKCQAPLKAPKDKVGARSNCRRCGCPIQVPDPEGSTYPIVSQTQPKAKVVTEAAVAEEPTRRHRTARRQGFPLWLIAVIIPVGLLFLCCGFIGLVSLMGRQAEPSESKSVDRNEAVGEVSVRCLRAFPLQFSGKEWGEWKMFGPSLVIELELANHSATKMVLFHGWQDCATVEDEYGNEYRRLNFSVGFGGFGDGPWNGKPTEGNIIAYNVNLHPSKTYVTYLFFEKPVDIAKKITLILPADKLEGTSTIRLQANISKLK